MTEIVKSSHLLKIFLYIKRTLSISFKNHFKGLSIIKS